MELLSNCVMFSWNGVCLRIKMNGAVTTWDETRSTQEMCLVVFCLGELKNEDDENGGELKLCVRDDG